MKPKRAAFVRGLYFDLQTIEGVQPLEIWNGFRERDDAAEAAALLKNLYKIAVPLVNEACFGRPFEEHGRVAGATVHAVMDGVAADMDGALYGRFPWPPTGAADQKELYQVIKRRTAAALAAVQGAEPRRGPLVSTPGSPESLFDFRELRIVDNELPYIIFTDKEYRVIHGIAIAYLWLMDLEGAVLRSFETAGVDAELRDEFIEVQRKVHKDNPFAVNGRMPPAAELLGDIQKRLAAQDYLDLFDGVYAWFEQARNRQAT
jgi:hypothetical protein